jgi:hypothetical protein
VNVPAALSWVLVFAGLWSVIAWVPFLLQVWKDPRSKDDKGNMTSYLTTRFMLITTSMILGIATLVIGFRLLAG